MKEIKDLPNYLIDNSGNVFSKLSNRFIKQHENENGYIIVALTVNKNKTKSFRVHRLVAITYIPNPDNLPEVNHKDGNKLNNHVDNLEWVTSKGNKDHAWALGLYKDKLQDHIFAKFSNEDIHNICKDIQNGSRNIDIARKYGTNKDHISHIKRGDIWKEISSEYDFNFKRKDRKNPETVIKVCELIVNGKSNKEISNLINISKQDINRIRNKEIFKNISDSYF